VSRRSVRSSAEDGFTLIEMAVVVIVLAVGAAVAVPAWRAGAVPDDITRATAVVDDLFRIARDSAIASGRAVTVVVDSVTSSVWMEVEPRPGGFGFDAPVAPERVAGEVRGTAALHRRSRFDPTPIGATRLPLPESIRLEVPRARSRFTFSPGGQAFSDSLVLSGISGRRTLTLDLGTGDVVSR